MPPFGNAVRFINGEKSDGNPLQPSCRICSRQPFRRNVDEAELASFRAFENTGLFRQRNRAIDECRWNSHLGQLRNLILHERN